MVPGTTTAGHQADTGGTVSETAQQVTDQAHEKALEVKDQAQEKAQDARRQASATVRTQVDERSTMAGERVTGAAADLRHVAQVLRQDDRTQPAQMAERAAERADRLGGYLKESDAERILSDVEDLARRNPGAVMLGGLALGFAASRILRASSADRHRRMAATRPAPSLGTGTPYGGTPYATGDGPGPAVTTGPGAGMSTGTPPVGGPGLVPPVPRSRP